MKTIMRDWKRVLPLAVLGCLVLAALAIGATRIIAPSTFDAVEPRASPTVTPLAHQAQAKALEVERRFKQAVAMLHAKQYEYAVAALHRVLELAPTMPEAHANMGYAMLGLERFAAARDFFLGAIELRPAQANAYYGLALALDAQNDRPGALGAMRSFVHLAKSDDAHVRKARAALWEWQTAAAQENKTTVVAQPGASKQLRSTDSIAK